MWQTLPSHLSPYILDLGFFRLHWYGFMYVVGFTAIILLVLYRLRTESFRITKEQFLDVFLWGVIGMFIGARLFYVLFYNLSFFLAHPLLIISPIDFSQGVRLVGIAGLSFHGGAIGIAVAFWWYCRKQALSLQELIELVLPTIPLAYFFGRIGNFFNGELWGRETTSAIGMYFPHDPSGLLRHPSQLYQGVGEGLVLFFLLWTLRKQSFIRENLLSIYLVAHGSLRFLLEFFREPDEQLGFITLGLSMGQLLSLAMIAVGIAVYLYNKKKQRPS